MPKVSIQRFNRKWVTRAPVDWQKYRKRFHAHEKIIILEKSGGGGGGMWPPHLNLLIWINTHFLAKKIPIPKFFSFPTQNSLYSTAFPLIIQINFPLSLLYTTNVYWPTSQHVDNLSLPTSKSLNIFTANLQTLKHIV